LKTYLVPIDFSPSAIHAAEFTAALSHQTDVDHIILMNAYYISSFEAVLPNTDMVQVLNEEIEENSKVRISQLESLKETLLKTVRPGVRISTHLNRSHLLDAVVDNVIDKEVDLVVLGSRGNSSEEPTQIGSHVIVISKASPVPLIIVPLAYQFKPISRIVIAWDFSKVEDQIPLKTLQKMLEKKDVDLLVVNVNNKLDTKANNAEQLAKDTFLYQALKPYNSKYFYLHDTDIINGILTFAKDQEAQLVIALPHKYSFFKSLLHSSVSYKLAKNAVVPVLILK
jgi:nucleotide-binding universal stress UspA family protein